MTNIVKLVLVEVSHESVAVELAHMSLDKRSDTASMKTLEFYMIL